MKPDKIAYHRITTELSMARDGDERWIAYIQTRTPRGYEQIDLGTADSPSGACRKAAHKLVALAAQYETIAKMHS
jgi:hypothetical protein